MTGSVFSIGYPLLLQYCKSGNTTYVKQIFHMSVDYGLLKDLFKDYILLSIVYQGLYHILRL